MQEELGVKVPLVHMKTFLSSNATMGHFWAVYLGELPLDWNFSPNAEVASVVKMSTKEIYEKLKLSPELFTQGFINVLTEFDLIKYKKTCYFSS